LPGKLKMARKKSIKLAAQQFEKFCNELSEYILEAEKHLGKKHISWSYEYGIIRLYSEFENLVLECLIGAVNNDTAILSQTTGYLFPLHLTDEVCRYLVVGNNYFDFKGRDGLIKTLKMYLPENHYLVIITKKTDYKDTLEKLSALRNFAAHGSDVAKRVARKAINQKNLNSSGSWLKRQNRFKQIIDKLKDLASEIKSQAPY